MRLLGLSPRRCRGLLALLERSLSPEAFAAAIGPYATNTIASIEHLQLVRVADAGAYELTDNGRAIARALSVLTPLRENGAHPTKASP